jgi:hypothetical protein
MTDDLKITDLSFVKAPRCDGCGEPMSRYDATRWICSSDECDQNTTPVAVSGVYPFTVVEPREQTFETKSGHRLVDQSGEVVPGTVEIAGEPATRDLRAICEEIVDYAKHGDLYDRSDLILELRAALSEPDELTALRERWAKLEQKVAQAMGHAQVARTTREAELCMKANNLKTAGCREHAKASGEMLLGVDEVRRAYAIFDALRSVQIWMEGYL